MIDAAIPLQTQAPQINNPLAVMSQIGQLKQQQQNLATGDIKQQGDQIALNQAQLGQQDQSDYRAAMAAAVDPNTGQVDRLKLLSTLGKLNPTAAAQTASGLATQDTAAKEAQAKAQQAQQAAISAHLDLKDKLFQGVTDPVTYANARNVAIQSGVNPQEIPPTYDPQWVAQAHAQTLSQKEQFQQQLDAAKQAESARHDTALESQSAATLANTQAYQKAELGIKGQELGLERQKLAVQQGDPTLGAQLLVNGDATLSELKARGATPEYIAKTLDAAHKLSGGKYNAQQADAQYSVAKSPTNVAFFGSAKSLTDPGGTLEQLAQVGKTIPGNQIPVFNTIADWEKAATGSGPIAKYAATALGVADDYAKVMGGGQGSDTSRKQALDIIKAAQSPEARTAAIQGIAGAVNSQMKSRIGSNPVLGRMYGSASTPAGKIIVTAPDGSTHPFDTQAQADKFKALAGIK